MICKAKSAETGMKPSIKCVECHCTESPVWHRSKSGESLCSRCFSVTSRQAYVNLSSISLSQSNANERNQIGSDKNSSCNDSLPKPELEEGIGKDTEENVILSDSEVQRGDTGVEDNLNNVESKNGIRGRNRYEKYSNATKYYSIRKSMRLKPPRTRQQNVKVLPTKGRGRRVIFKKNPMKAPASVCSVVTRDYIFHKGSYWQVGDIASVLDDEDERLYYVQLRGFMQDQYLEKSAVITWLVPRGQTDPRAEFNPADYCIGFEEDIPRKMDAFDFICHAPSDYYRAAGVPYRIRADQPEVGFVWTRLGNPVIGQMAALQRRINEEFDENNEDYNDGDVSDTEELGTRTVGGGVRRKRSSMQNGGEERNKNCAQTVGSKDRTKLARM